MHDPYRRAKVWKVWCPDDEQEPLCDNVSIDRHVAEGPEDEAAYFAEVRWLAAGKPSEQLIYVRMSDGTLEKFIVEARAMPFFVARRVH
jgi:hypothetical protein